MSVSISSKLSLKNIKDNNLGVDYYCVTSISVRNTLIIT